MTSLLILNRLSHRFNRIEINEPPDGGLFFVQTKQNMIAFSTITTACFRVFTLKQAVIFQTFTLDKQKISVNINTK